MTLLQVPDMKLNESKHSMSDGTPLRYEILRPSTVSLTDIWLY